MFLRDNYQLQSALLGAYNAGYEFVKPSTPATLAHGHIIIAGASNLLSGGSPDTIKVGDVTFTAHDGPTSVNSEFDASGTDVETAENLMNAINSHPGVVCCVLATMPEPLEPFINLEAKIAGESGNSISLIYTSYGAYPGIITSATSLQGGTNASVAGEAHSVLASGLAEASSKGETEFTIVCTTNHNPDVLRLENKYLKTYYCGIRAGMSSEHIYDYEYTLELDTTDTSVTRIRFNFNF